MAYLRLLSHGTPTDVEPSAHVLESQASPPLEQPGTLELVHFSIVRLPGAEHCVLFGARRAIHSLGIQDVPLGAHSYQLTCMAICF